MSEPESPDTRWVIVSPGTIALPTTGFTITFDPLRLGNEYNVLWNGNVFGRSQDMKWAKEQVDKKMREMMDMGLTP